MNRIKIPSVLKLFETAHHMVSQISNSDFFNRVDCLDKLNNKQNKLENRLGLF